MTDNPAPERFSYPVQPNDADVPPTPEQEARWHVGWSPAGFDVLFRPDGDWKTAIRLGAIWSRQQITALADYLNTLEATAARVDAETPVMKRLWQADDHDALQARVEALEAEVKATWDELAEIDGHESLAKAVNNAITRRNIEVLQLDSLLMRAEARVEVAELREAMAEQERLKQDAYWQAFHAHESKARIKKLEQWGQQVHAALDGLEVTDPDEAPARIMALQARAKEAETALAVLYARSETPGFIRELLAKIEALEQALREMLVCTYVPHDSKPDQWFVAPGKGKAFTVAVRIARNVLNQGTAEEGVTSP